MAAGCAPGVIGVARPKEPAQAVGVEGAPPDWPALLEVGLVALADVAELAADWVAEEGEADVWAIVVQGVIATPSKTAKCT